MYEKTNASNSSNPFYKHQVNGANQKKISRLWIIAAIIVALIGFNELPKAIGALILNGKLSGKTFNDMRYRHELRLRNEDIHYDFYGAKSDFEFDKDGNVKWTRVYNRCNNGVEWTEPVTTTEKYKVVYLGGFLYDSTAFYVKLENGDILDVEYTRENGKKVIEGLNYSILHEDNMYAPEALLKMDTYTIDNFYDGSSKSSSGKECYWCKGTGKVKYNYGSSDLEAIIDGHEASWYGQCGSCGGTGKEK